MRNIIIAILSSSLMFSCGQVSEIELPHIISDGMVLQQSSEMTFWGKALPGARVTVSTDWDYTATATALQDSTWQAKFPTIAADGKSHKIVISAADTVITINDVLLGEVWFAGGQTNMGVPLKGWSVDSVAGGLRDIELANDNQLRIFNEANQLSWRLKDDVMGSWKSANPSNARDFSAVAYHFAKSLRDSLQVPVGVITGVVGSSTCEAWVSPDKLLTTAEFGHKVAHLDMLADEYDRYNEWLKTLPRIKLKNGNTNEERIAAITVNDEFVTLSTPNCDTWDAIDLPQYWNDQVLGDFDGVVWFVKQVTIPRKWVGQNLTIYIGKIDDCDVTYVNGICIGSHHRAGEYNLQRVYNVPAKVVESNVLTVAVRVTDTYGQGGFGGCDGGMRIEGPRGETVSIEGEWKYRPAGEFVGTNMILFDPVGDVFSTRPKQTLLLSVTSASALYNGMVNPISKYKIRGIIWHQGEANRDASLFSRLVPMLVESFRDAFGDSKLPIYMAQLYPWEYKDNSDHSVADMREAQRRGLASMDNSGLISLLDLSVDFTKHSPYKAQEGQRFARMALNKVYGRKDIVASGPRLVDVDIQGQLLSLTFENAEGMYINHDRVNEFEIAGEDKVFFSASPIVDGNKITLFSHAVPVPKYVRYAGRNNSSATLFNGAGLPAESFATMEDLGVQ